MSIFVDEIGKPIRFFLQQNLEPEVLARLANDIVKGGGVVLDKVPLQGFVLVDPNSKKGTQLLAKWRKPGRRVVPTTFVVACLDAGSIIPQVFVSGDAPLRINIHTSIQDQMARDRACERIWHFGGDPTATTSGADVIIVNTDASIHRIQAEQADVHVEPLKWVKRCIDQGICEFTHSKPSAVVLRPSNKRRTQFSSADDNHLVAYLAHRHPDASMIGRKGRVLYEELCDNPLEYPWAARHPWQSWRERYVKRQDTVDRQIEAYIRKANMASDGIPTTNKLAASPSSSGTNSRNTINSENERESEASPKSEPRGEKNGSDSEWAILDAPDNAIRPDWARRELKRSHPDKGTEKLPLKKARSDMLEIAYVRWRKRDSLVERNVSTETLTAGVVSSDEITRNAPIRSDNENIAQERYAGIGPETQQLLNDHDASKQLQENRINSPQDLSQPEDLQERLGAISKETRFWLEDVCQFYTRTQDLSLTEKVFRSMRNAANEIMHKYQAKH